MVTFSPFPHDPRPRRAIAALLNAGMSVDLVCLGDDDLSRTDGTAAFNIYRIPIANRRGSKLSYVFRYATFILLSTLILALRSLRHRYDLVYVHNMPDILVVTALLPKTLGAKIILDLHDPMPELMETIFGLTKDSISGKLIRYLEKWSIDRADLVLTVNAACRRLFAERSGGGQKIAVVMNSPDEAIFSFRPPKIQCSASSPKSARFVIMYHGSLVERNGLDLAVEAMAPVRKVVSGAELRIYGRATPFLDRVMSRVRNTGLENHVRYLGPKSLEELVQVIADCDVGVIPNRDSAFAAINTPTRIFEYLVLGKPVIAPYTQGIADYFDDKALVYFEPGNAQDLSRKIEYVFSHPGEVTERIKKGQAVYQGHSWYIESRHLTSLVGGLIGNCESTSSADRRL
jgi:glycosyltransferase involved in cell wall biosynthesis